MLKNILDSGELGKVISISKSVESHLMACAIEQSRLTGKVVDLEEFRKSLA